jgi:hypothetical protein
VLLNQFRECLKCDGEPPGLIRVVDSDYEIDQVVGGTQGTDYVYVYDGDSFINVRYLRGCELVARRERGRGRLEETYRVPGDVLEGKLILLMSFSNSGNAFLKVCEVCGNSVKCCGCSPLEEDDELAMQVAAKFKPLGEEIGLVRFYLNTIPKLAGEVLDVVRRSGAGEILFAGRAKRFRETIYSPGFSLLTSMVLVTAERRARSLLIKMSHVVELATAAKVVEFLNGASLEDHWWVEFTWNRPLVTIRSQVTGREYTVFFQPSILPPRLLYPNAPKHVVPDIVVFEGKIGGVGLGRLHELIESGNVPLLAIEVKTGLQLVRWERPDYVISQLRTYKNLLKPKNFALVSLRDVDTLLKVKLKALGVEVFENIAGDITQRKFRDYVLKALAT